jgi:hypothetical protein
MGTKCTGIAPVPVASVAPSLLVLFQFLFVLLGPWTDMAHRCFVLTHLLLRDDFTQDHVARRTTEANARVSISIAHASDPYFIIIRWTTIADASYCILVHFSIVVGSFSLCSFRFGH